MNIGLWLERAALAAPRHPALFLGRDRVADYAGFDARARAVAGGLLAQGVAPGDRVALFMGNAPDYLTALYGIWYAGAVAVPINAKLHGAEAAWIIDNAAARLTLADSTGQTALAAQGLVAPRPHDRVLLAGHLPRGAAAADDPSVAAAAAQQDDDFQNPRWRRNPLFADHGQQRPDVLRGAPRLQRQP